MKYLIHLFLFMLLANSSLATDYYISNAGNDTLPGTHRDSAWQTITKLESVISTLQPGDKVLFDRSSTFNSSLTMTGLSGNRNGYIYFSAYGRGAGPVFNGGAAVSGWQVHSLHATGNVYVVTLTNYPDSIELKSVLYDGNFLMKGREPDLSDPEPWLYNDVTYPDNTRNEITDNELPAWLTDRGLSDNYFAGASVVAKGRAWTMDKGPVVSHVGSVISLTTNHMTYGIRAGYGYYFTDHLYTLDQEGEWFYDKASKKLYLYSSENPENHDIVISVINNGLVTTNCSYLHFQFLKFINFKERAVDFNNLSNSVFFYNEIKYSATNGVDLNNCAYLNIGWNSFDYTQNNNFTGSADNTYIHDNSFSQAGMWFGMGNSHSGNYANFKLNGENNILLYNEINQSGYNAIHFGGYHWTIAYNQVDSFNLLSADGGGIYIWDYRNADNWIYRNIIRNGYAVYDDGTPESIDGRRRGLYSDGAASGNLWESNTIINCDEGMLLHQSSEETVLYNKFIGSTTNGLRIAWDNGHYVDIDSRNNNVQHNIFVHRNSSFPHIRLWSQKNDVDSFGIINNNIHVEPFSTVNYLTPLLYSSEAQAKHRKYANQRSVSDFPYGANDYLSPVWSERFSAFSNPGPNLMNNSTMDNSFYPNSNLANESTMSSSSFSVSKEATVADQINGATMKVMYTNSVPSDTGVLVHKSVPVTKGEFYRVRIKTKGSVPNWMDFMLRTSTSSFIHAVQPLNIETGQRDYIFTVQAQETASNGRVFIYFPAQNQTDWLDDVYFERVDVAEKNYYNIVRVLENTNKNAKSFQNFGTSGYVDIDGNPVSDNITLAPFETKVIFKP